MKPPALAQAERALNVPAKAWSGRCYEIACAFVDRELVPTGSVAVYGHWRGPVARGSRFHRGKEPPTFVQHGWVLLPDASVVDPTRWVFEAVAPYIYAGPADYYDEGGNAWREAQYGPTPPKFSAGEKTVEFTELAMPDADAWRFVEELLGLRGHTPRTMTISQLFWIANRSPQKLAPHALAVYAAICKIGKGSLIPIDNLRRVEREHRTRL